MNKKIDLGLTVGQLYYGRLGIFDKINPAYKDELTGEYDTRAESIFIRHIFGIVNDNNSFCDLIKGRTYLLGKQDLVTKGEKFVFGVCKLSEIFSKPILNKDCPVTPEVIDEIDKLLQRSDFMHINDQIRKELHERYPDLYVEPEELKAIKKDAVYESILNLRLCILSMAAGNPEMLMCLPLYEFAKAYGVIKPDSEQEKSKVDSEKPKVRKLLPFGRNR